MEEEVRRAEEFWERMLRVGRARGADEWRPHEMGVDGRAAHLKFHPLLVEMKEEAVAWFKKLLGKEAYGRLRRIQPVTVWISTDWDDTEMMRLEYSAYKRGPAKKQRKGFWCERYIHNTEEDMPLPEYLKFVEGEIMRRLVGSYPASVLLELAENWEGELYTAECVKWREESRGVVMGLFEGGQEDLQRLVLEFTGAR